MPADNDSFDQKLEDAINNRYALKSISLNISLNNEGKSSLYKRLAKYAKDKGFSKQDAMRFFIANGLEKAGYSSNQ